MSFLLALFYDRAIAKTEKACLSEWRSQLLQEVHGEVLEIGAGTGASIEFYPGEVTRLVLTEPDRHMRNALQQKIPEHWRDRIEVANGSAESLPVADDSFDFVVSSLVCCSVQNLQGCLREAHRILKPGGRLVFMEHVAAARGTTRRRWQNTLNPLWKLCMGNCHLNRETEAAIVAAGFEIRQIERESMRKAPPVVRPTIRGQAEKPRD